MPRPREPFDYNPSPRPGTYDEAYGGVPGTIGRPDPFGELSAIYPNLSQSNAQLSENVLAQQRGELSPNTVDDTWDDAARYGITSGMPGGDLSKRRAVKQLGLEREAQVQRGIQNYLASLAGVSRTQTVSPELETEIANRNAIMNSAPVPRANAEELQRIFDRNTGIGRGGGGVTYSGSRGGMPSVGTNPPGASDFFANSNPGGTGFAPQPYRGDYISPLGAGQRAGGGTGDPDNYWGQFYDDFWSDGGMDGGGFGGNDPVFEYNPTGPNPNIGGEDFFGNGPGGGGPQYYEGSNPSFGPGGSYDPTFNYEDNIYAGDDYAW